MEQNHLVDEVQLLQEKQQQEIEKYITEIRNGSRDAFDDFYRCTESFVYYCIVKNGVPEDAIADMMQEVYAGIYQNLGTLQDIHAAMGWVKSIAFHKSMDYFRHSKKEVLIKDEEQYIIGNDLADTMELPEDIVDNKESQKIIRDLIEQLPEDSRQILVAYYFQECKVDEIADALGIPVGTVKTKLFRARKQLQESIVKVEKTQGIRLHSIAAGPILLLLFHQEVQSAVVPTEVTRTVKAGLKNISKHLPESDGATMGSKSPHTSEVAAKAVSAGGKLAGGVIKKALIGIAVVLFAGIGIVFVYRSNRNPADSDTTSEESTDTTENTSEEAQTEEPLQEIDPERQAKIRQYYHDMYDKICETQQWPDGNDLAITSAITGDFMENMQYTVLDFDGDGYEEFVVSVMTADYMAACMERMYKYNPDTEQCTCLLTISPGAEYYNNGVAYGAMDNSHRFGSDFFRYDASAEVFVRQIYVFQWNRNEWEDYNGYPFPGNSDVDGDGIVWCFIDPNDHYSYMDQAEYEAWRQQELEPSRKLEVPWTLFSEEWKY